MSDDLIERAENALADGNGNSYLYAGLLREAINEVKRQDEGIAGLMKEITKWRAIAIEATARHLYPFKLPSWDRLPEEDVIEHGSHLVQRGKVYWRSVAAKELDLHINQEKSYLKRLEEAYLIAEKRLIAFHYRCKKGENMQDAVNQAAQAALVKIRDER